MPTSDTLAPAACARCRRAGASVIVMHCSWGFSSPSFAGPWKSGPREPSMMTPPLSVDGCHAEYFLAEAAFAARVPDGIDPTDAAPPALRGRDHFQGR